MGVWSGHLPNPAVENERTEVDGRSSKTGDGKGTPDELHFGGRVFVRDTLKGVDAGGDTNWTENREIASARAFLDFRPNKRLKMVLEIEFGEGDADLKDVFVRYRPIKTFGIKAGHFKKPVSFIALESNWSLPRIDRGLFSDYGVVDLPFAGGRGYGVAAEFAPGGPLEPEVTLTTMQSEVGGALDVTENVNQDLYGRAEVKPIAELALAVAGGWVGVFRDEGVAASYGHRSFGTLEARFEVERLRAWAEVTVGQNLTAYVDDNLHGGFVASRGLVAGRFDRAIGLRSVEPYVAASWLDPSTEVSDDRALELTAGAAFWISRNLRLQAEAGRITNDADQPIADQTLIRLQLASAFEGETELD